jgi:hypothetical protein
MPDAEKEAFWYYMEQGLLMEPFEHRFESQFKSLSELWPQQKVDYLGRVTKVKFALRVPARYLREKTRTALEAFVKHSNQNAPSLRIRCLKLLGRDEEIVTAQKQVDRVAKFLVEKLGKKPRPKPMRYIPSDSDEEAPINLYDLLNRSSSSSSSSSSEPPADPSKDTHPCTCQKRTRLFRFVPSILFHFSQTQHNTKPSCDGDGHGDGHGGGEGQGGAEEIDESVPEEGREGGQQR